MKPTKVVFEYADGSKKYIEDEELEKWNAFNFQVAAIAQTHNFNPPWQDIKWKNVGEDKTY